MSENPIWYRDPRGIASAIVIVSTLAGFFLVRERQLWDQSTRIAAVESRGDKAILQVDARFQRHEEWLAQLKEQVNFLERKIDALEYKAAEAERWRKGKERDEGAPY